MKKILLLALIISAIFVWKVTRENLELKQDLTICRYTLIHIDESL